MTDYDSKIVLKIDDSKRESGPSLVEKSKGPNLARVSSSESIAKDGHKEAEQKIATEIGKASPAVPKGVVDFESIKPKTFPANTEPSVPESGEKYYNIKQTESASDMDPTTESAIVGDSDRKQQRGPSVEKAEPTKNDTEVKPQSKVVETGEVIDSASFRRPVTWSGSNTGSKPSASIKPAPSESLTESTNHGIENSSYGEVIDSSKYRRSSAWALRDPPRSSESSQKQSARPVKKYESPVTNKKETTKEIVDPPPKTTKAPKQSSQLAEPVSTVSGPVSTDFTLESEKPQKSNSPVPEDTKSAVKHESDTMSVPPPSEPRSSHDEGPKSSSLSNKSTEGVVSKPLATTDGNVDMLRAELASQAKWEAVRLQEAVRSQMVEDKKIAAREAAELAYKHAEEVARVREQANAESRKLLSERTRELKEAYERDREKEVSKLLKSREEDLRNEIISEFTQNSEKMSTERHDQVTKADAEVKALSQRFQAVVDQTERVKEASKRASGAFLLREAIRGCTPLSKDLTAACGESELGKLVRKSIPESALQDGICSEESLRKDFDKATKHGLSVAVVPENKTGSVWAHILGSIFSKLKVPVDMRAEGNVALTSNEKRIRYAKQLMEEGNIESAVETLDKVDGLAGEVLSDWVNAAKARIAAGLAGDVLLADAIISQLSLTAGETSA